MLHVLFEDNHCLVVAKPAGVLMAGDETGDRTLLDDVRDYLREKYQKPGNVFVGLVHRLDRPVSGVALYARTSKAAARLAAQFRDGTVRKIYHARVRGNPPRQSTELRDWLVKDATTNISRVAPENSPGAKSAVLTLRTLESAHGTSLVEVQPQTGRPHQIRVQLAARGWSILGDTKYGGPSGQRPGAIALHARSLTFQHPTLGEPVCVELPVPAVWSEWFPI